MLIRYSNTLLHSSLNFSLSWFFKRLKLAYKAWIWSILYINFIIILWWQASTRVYIYTCTDPIWTFQGAVKIMKIALLFILLTDICPCNIYNTCNSRKLRNTRHQHSETPAHDYGPWLSKVKGISESIAFLLYVYTWYWSHELWVNIQLFSQQWVIWTYCK